MYKYCLFDLDGTLTDPSEGITNSVMYALDKFGINVEDRKSLYVFIGPPLKDSFQSFYGFSDEQSEEAIKYYREYFKDKGIFENEVYDGIEKMLSNLRNSGKHIILATSKPEEFAKRILEHFHLIQYFDFVAGATMDGSRSKKGDIIKYALEQCNITDLSEAVMIGDREHDINGAKYVGIDSIGVLYGYGDYEEHKKAGADYIVKEVKDIVEYVI